MNKSTKIITRVSGKMYRIAGIQMCGDHYLVNTSGIKVERTNSSESFIKALEIARSDIAKGILPRSYRETDRTLPCGASEARVYWSPILSSLSCRFNIDSLKLSDGYTVKINGEPSLDNEEYVKALKVVVKERDRINKEHVIPRLLALYDERIKMFKDIDLGKAVEVLDNAANVDGIPLPPGISKSVRGFNINIADKYHLVSSAAGGSELERFKEACEIAADLAEKGLYPYCKKVSAPKLPCGTVEKSITHKKVKDGHQFTVFYNGTQLNKFYRRTFTYTGKASIHNPNYRDMLREAISCRDERERYIADSYYNLYLETAIAIQKRIREHGPGEVTPKRYSFRANEYGIKASDNQILGIPLVIGLSLYQTSGIRIGNLSYNDRVRFSDYPHPLYAFKVACEKLLESYQRHGIGRLSREPSILAEPLPHGKVEKYISLREGMKTHSLRVTVKSSRLGFRYGRSFNYNGVGGVDNHDYMLKLGQAIRARDKAVNKLVELVYSELRSTIRNINLKIDALEGVKNVETKEQLPLTATFEEGLTDSDIVELKMKETRHKEVDIDRSKYYDGYGTDTNVVVRVGSDGVIYHIDTNKKAKIEIFDASTGVKKLVSMNLVDLSVAESHSITGNYNGKEHEIQFTVNGRYLTLHSVNVSDGLEFILTEE